MKMLAGTIRWAGITAAAIMMLSFVLFATEQSGGASKEQVGKIDGRTPCFAPQQGAS